MGEVDFDNDINILSVQFALSNFSNAVDGNSFKSLNEILMNFRNKTNAWLEVECLFNTNDEAQVIYGIIILIDLIKQKWRCLSNSHKESISKFVMGKVLKLATLSNISNTEETILRKFNHCLIELFFTKWAQDEWSSLIPDLLQSCYVNEYLCQNNLLIFKQLYEIIFTNDSVNLTREKINSLKQHLSSSFDKIFRLTFSILELSRNVILVLRALELFEVFMQLKFDVAKESDKIFSCLSNLLLVSVVRRDCIRTIIIFLKFSKMSSKIVDYFKRILEQLIKVIPSSVVLKDNFMFLKPEDQSFLIQIADLISTNTPLLYSELSVENETSNYLEDAWVFLLRLTEIESDENIRTICFEYWSQLANLIYAEKTKSIEREDSKFITKAQVYLSEVSEIVISNCCSSSLDSLFQVVFKGQTQECIDPLMKSMQNMYKKYFFLNPKTGIEQIKSKFTNLLTSPNVPIKQIYSISLCMEFVMVSQELLDIVNNVSNFNSNSEEYQSTTHVELVDLLVEMMRFSMNSLLTLQNQMLTFKDQVPIFCSLIHAMGCFCGLGRYNISFSDVIIRRICVFMSVGYDLIRNMALASLRKWVVYNKVYFLEGKTPGTVSETFEKLITDVSTRVIYLNHTQILDLYESLTYTVVAIENDKQLQANYLQLLFNYPNKALSEIMNVINRDVAKLLDIAIVNSLKLILDINIRFCRLMKTLYLLQLSETFPFFLNLFNLFSMGLSRIQQKSSKGAAEMKSVSPMSQLINLHQLSLEYLQTVIFNITWTGEAYLELSSCLVPLLLSDQARWIPSGNNDDDDEDDNSNSCIDRDTCLQTLRFLVDGQQSSISSSSSSSSSSVSSQHQQPSSTDISLTTIVTILTSIIPSGRQARIGGGNSIRELLLLIRTIMHRYASAILSHTQLLPFIRLVQLIDFVLWGLQANWNETKQICYNIVEYILQFYESDRVNAHQRKKFIRQFYLHIFQTILISALDDVRISEEDGFTRVMGMLCRWLSSSLVSFRLLRDHHYYQQSQSKRSASNLQQIISGNRDVVVKTTSRILAGMYPHSDSSIHSNIVLNLIRCSNTPCNDHRNSIDVLTNGNNCGNNSKTSCGACEAMNDAMRDYKVIVNQHFTSCNKSEFNDDGIDGGETSSTSKLIVSISQSKDPEITSTE